MSTPTPRTQAACDLPFDTWEDKASQLQEAMRNLEVSHAQAVSALRDAAMRFDLLAGWEAGDNLTADFYAMKDTAKDAHREARAALAKVTP
jgi:hypothetical protein